MSRTVAENPHAVAGAARETDEWAWLFDHQDEVVDAVEAGLMPRPGSRKRRFRVQIHLAPGLGKTWIAYKVRDRVAPGGGFLFTAPTRGLVEQHYRSLRAYGWQGPVIALYADRDAALAGLEDEGVQVAGSARRLAELAAGFRAQGTAFVVLTTYASVEKVIEAHQLPAGEGVAPLAEWELVATDEAHHTELSPVWGRINSQRLVPAWRRLAMTATSRLMGTLDRTKGGRLVVTAAVRMSEKIHGPVVYRMGLSTAQRRGKLAHSRVVAAEVDEARLREMVARHGRADPGVQAELLASASGAVLRAAGRFGCRRMLTYHRTVAGARAAAEAMAEQSWLLHAQGTTAPERVFAVALDEESSSAERAAALAALADGTDLEGQPVDLVVVCSVGVLAEGIDVPAVDAVALVEPRRMPHILLQIAGRAVRFDRDNPEKVASIIVPVIHLEGPAGDGEVGESADWDPVTNMLRAVESYEPDGGSASRSASPEESTGRTRSAVTDKEKQERREERARQLADMLEFTTERSRRAVVDWVRFRVVNDPAAGDLLRVMEAAAAFHQERHSLAVPEDWEHNGLLLAVELDKLRRRARADRDDLDRLVAQRGGDIEEARAEWLRRGPRIHPTDMAYFSGMGFEWNPRADGRALLLAAARAYLDAHGHLLPHRGESINLGGEDIPVSDMLVERRRPGIQDAGLDKLRKDYLQRYDPDGAKRHLMGAVGAWRVPENVPWNAAFHRQLGRLQLFRAEGGRRAELLRGPRPYRGGDLGRWLRAQHVRWKELHEAQRQALKALRMGPATGAPRVHAAAAPVQRRSRTERAQELAAAARRHLAEAGPLTDKAGRITVADSYRPLIDGREVQLRKRLYTVRDSFPGYPPELKTLFAGLGLPWATPEPGEPGPETEPAGT